MSDHHVLIGEVAETGLLIAQAHREFLEAEVGHRKARHQAEHRLREAHPKMPAGAIALLIDSDPKYLVAQQRWNDAQVGRTSAIAVHEVAKLRAWAAVRSLG